MSNLINNNDDSEPARERDSLNPVQSKKSPTKYKSINSSDKSSSDEIFDDTKPKAKTTNRSQMSAANPAAPSTPAHVINSEETDEQMEEIQLKYGASHVIKLFLPVTICIVFVIISLTVITSYQKSGGQNLIYTPFNEQDQSDGTKLWMSVANASIFIGVVVVMTIVLILFYKFKFYKLIHGWLAFSTIMLLFFFNYMFISELFKQFNLVVDMFTVSIYIWNFGIIGMFAIHWKGPLFLQQAFNIFSCTQMALLFIKYLPDWTTWVLLAFISIWDLIAVLCPFGPLRILVETARSRNDTLFPGMVYSSTLMYTLMNVDGISAAPTPQEMEIRTTNSQTASVAAAAAAQTHNNDEDDGGFGNSDEHKPAKKRTSGNNQLESVRIRLQGAETRPPIVRTEAEELELKQQEEEENGVKLGLGDFIFYSILVGKASILGDWMVVIACFVAILIGLCLTLVLLAVFHKPLPALPISLFFGLIFYFVTNLVVRPFYDELTYRQIFI
jgi:presenilin 1